MKYFYKELTLGLLLIIISGCTSPKIQSLNAPKEDNSATITVFRPDVSFNMGNEMIVSINDIDVVTLFNNEYMSAKVVPGFHTVSVRASAGFKSSVDVSLKSLDVKYFEAAGSSNNSVNFIPGTYLLKSNFYIDKADLFDVTEYTEKKVTYN